MDAARAPVRWCQRGRPRARSGDPMSCRWGLEFPGGDEADHEQGGVDPGGRGRRGRTSGRTSRGCCTGSDALGVLRRGRGRAYSPGIGRGIAEPELSAPVAEHPAGVKNRAWSTINFENIPWDGTLLRRGRRGHAAQVSWVMPATNRGGGPADDIEATAWVTRVVNDGDQGPDWLAQGDLSSRGTIGAGSTITWRPPEVDCNGYEIRAAGLDDQPVGAARATSTHRRCGSEMRT